jgi:hypothetical protein
MADARVAPVITIVYGWYHPSFSPISALKTAIFAISRRNHAPFLGIVGNVQRFCRRLQTERTFFPRGKAKRRKSA